MSIFRLPDLRGNQNVTFFDKLNASPNGMQKKPKCRTFWFPQQK